MLIALKKSPKDVILKEEEIPEIAETEVLIRVVSCGVCGGDVGYSDEYKYFGHEFAGIVEKCGRCVSRQLIGMRVAVMSGAPCGICKNCLNGKTDKCSNMVIGSYKGFAEYAKVDARNVVLLPDFISFKHAAIVEPLGVAIDLVKTAEIELGDNVLIIGAGTIGLMAVQLALKMGAASVSTVMHSTSAKKAEIAREFGVKDIYFNDSKKLNEILPRSAQFDKVLITAPPCIIPEALNFISYGGTAVYLGFGGNGDITFDAHRFHRKKLSLRASFAAPGIYFPLAFDAIKSGIIAADKIITHVMPLEMISDLMYIAGCERDKCIKCVMLRQEFNI